MEAEENEPSCSIERSLEVLGERWTFLILRSAFLGTTRFADFRSALGIAPNLLSARLRTLVAAGILEPQQYREPGSRTRVSYHLTESGKQLRLILAACSSGGRVPAAPGRTLHRPALTHHRPPRARRQRRRHRHRDPLEDLAMQPTASRDDEPQAV